MAPRFSSYATAVRRVNKKRPVVREDVLRLGKIGELAGEAGFAVDVRRSPTTTYRGPVETVYYMALKRLPPLQRLLPCTVDIIFAKACMTR